MAYKTNKVSDDPSPQLVADLDAQDTYQITNLASPAASNEAIRQTANITETNLTTVTDGSNADSLHTHLSGASVLEIQIFS